MYNPTITEKAEDRPQINLTRRRFLRAATYASGAVVLGSMFAAMDGTYGAIYERAKLHPSAKELDAARKTVADFDNKTQELAIEGRLNELPGSVDANVVQTAYQTIDKDRNPERHYPSEVIKETNSRAQEMSDRGSKFFDIAVLSEIIMGIGVILGKSVDDTIREGKNPSRIVGIFIQKAPSETTTTA